MRSSTVSTCPNIMVAVVARLWRWAMAMTSSQSSLMALSGEILAYAVDENFAAAAGYGTESGHGKVAHQVFERFIKDIAEMHNRSG